MPKAWSAKRERQYEHIKDGLEDRGTSEKKAEEIAARTVNKERARSGEADLRRSARTFAGVLMRPAEHTSAQSIVGL